MEREDAEQVFRRLAKSLHREVLRSMQYTGPIFSRGAKKAALVIVALALMLHFAQAAPSTWKVVNLNRIDVKCWGYWYAIQRLTTDDREATAAERRTTEIVHHYTIDVFWKRSHPMPEEEEEDIAVPDIAETDYYAFQQSVANQIYREAGPFSDRWMAAWNQRPSKEWDMEHIRCLARDADLMQHRRTLDHCMHVDHCIMPFSRLI